MHSLYYPVRTPFRNKEVGGQTHEQNGIRKSVGCRLFPKKQGTGRHSSSAMRLDPPLDGGQPRIVVQPETSLLVLGAEVVDDALVGDAVQLLNLQCK